MNLDQSNGAEKIGTDVISLSEYRSNRPKREQYPFDESERLDSEAMHYVDLGLELSGSKSTHEESMAAFVEANKLFDKARRIKEEIY